MKIKQTKTKVEDGFHTEEISIYGIPKDTIIDILRNTNWDEVGHQTKAYCKDALADIIEDLSEGETVEY